MKDRRRSATVCERCGREIDPAIGACIECSRLGRHHLIGEPIRLRCGHLDGGSAVRVPINPEERAEDLDSASGIAVALRGQKSDRNRSAQQRTDGKCH